MQQDQDIELSDKMAAFVSAYITNGGIVGKAALKAGYAQANEGSRLLKNPRVISEIQRQMMDAIGVSAVMALSTVKKLAKTAKSDYVKLEAAKDILNRAGYVPPTRIDHRVAADLTVSFDTSPEQSGMVISGESQQTTQREGGVGKRGD